MDDLGDFGGTPISGNLHIQDTQSSPISTCPYSGSPQNRPYTYSLCSCKLSIHLKAIFQRRVDRHENKQLDHVKVFICVSMRFEEPESQTTPMLDQSTSRMITCQGTSTLEINMFFKTRITNP